MKWKRTKPESGWGFLLSRGERAFTLKPRPTSSSLVPAAHRDNKPPSSHLRKRDACRMTTALPQSRWCWQAYCLCIRNPSTPPVDLQPHGWRDSPTPEVPSPYPSLLNLLFSFGTLLSLQLIRGKGGNSSTDIKSEFKIWLSPNTHTQSKISFSPGYPFIHIHPGEWQAGLPHRVDKRLQICMYDLAL